MNWVVLFVAGLLEVVWAVGLKYTEGFTRFWPSVMTASALLISLGMLSWAMRDLPVGTAYAVWVGIGAVGTAVVGMVLLGEPATVSRLASIGLILVGIIGLKLPEQFGQLDALLPALARPRKTGGASDAALAHGDLPSRRPVRMPPSRGRAAVSGRDGASSPTRSPDGAAQARSSGRRNGLSVRVRNSADPCIPSPAIQGAPASLPRLREPTCPLSF